MIPADLPAEQARVLGLLEAFNKADADYERACEASGDNPTPEQRRKEELADECRDAWLEQLGYPPLILEDYAEALGELARVRGALEVCAAALQDNLQAWTYKNEPVMFEALKAAQLALAPAPEVADE